MRDALGLAGGPGDVRTSVDHDEEFVLQVRNNLQLKPLNWRAFVLAPINRVHPPISLHGFNLRSVPIQYFMRQLASLAIKGKSVLIAYRHMPLHLQVTCDSDAFRLIVRDDPGYAYFPHEIITVPSWMDFVVITGPIDVRFMAFGPRGEADITSQSRPLNRDELIEPAA